MKNPNIAGNMDKIDFRANLNLTFVCLNKNVEFVNYRSILFIRILFSYLSRMLHYSFRKKNEYCEGLENGYTTTEQSEQIIMIKTIYTTGLAS